jgi:hypothetical protein
VKHVAPPHLLPNQLASPAPKVQDSDLNYTDTAPLLEQPTFQPYFGGSPLHEVAPRVPATKAAAPPPWHPTSHPSQTLEPHGRHMRESDLHSVLAAKRARSLASPPMPPMPTPPASQSDFHPHLARSPRRDVSPSQTLPSFVMGRRSPSPRRPWHPSSAAGVIGAADLESALSATVLHGQGIADRGVRDTDHVAALLAGQWHSVPVADSMAHASAKDLEHEIEAMDRQSVADAEIARLSGHRREA